MKRNINFHAVQFTVRVSLFLMAAFTIGTLVWIATLV